MDGAARCVAHIASCIPSSGPPTPAMTACACAHAYKHTAAPHQHLMTAGSVMRFQCLPNASLQPCHACARQQTAPAPPSMRVSSTAACPCACSKGCTLAKGVQGLCAGAAWAQHKAREERISRRHQEDLQGAGGAAPCKHCWHEPAVRGCRNTLARPAAAANHSSVPHKCNDNATSNAPPARAPAGSRARPAAARLALPHRPASPPPPAPRCSRPAGVAGRRRADLEGGAGCRAPQRKPAGMGGWLAGQVRRASVVP